MWILGQGKKCRKFRLPLNSLIGQFFHPVGGEWMVSISFIIHSCLIYNIYTLPPVEFENNTLTYSANVYIDKKLQKT